MSKFQYFSLVHYVDRKKLNKIYKCLTTRQVGNPEIIFIVHLLGLGFLAFSQKLVFYL